MILGAFYLKETPHSEVAFWLSSSEFLFVRIFICVGTMAAAFYNQTTLFYNQTNTLPSAFISRERSMWTQCYFCDKNGRQLAIEL